MSIFAAILIAALSVGSTVAGTANLGGLNGNYLDHAITTGGWWLFFACLFGMIAAAVGGSHGRLGEPRVGATTTALDRDRNLRAA